MTKIALITFFAIASPVAATAATLSITGSSDGTVSATVTIKL